MRLPRGEAMKTLGSVLDEQNGFGQGFDFLRIFLATGIIASHTAQLSGHFDLVQGSVFWLLDNSFVPMFFALSGFLVAGSSMRLGPRSFLLNRMARIVPALAVDIVFAALIIGPLVTTLPLKAYLSDPMFHSYFLNIIGSIHFDLPGVFQSNPSTSVNGSLWTVPFEICCYVVLVGLMVSGAMKDARWISWLTVGILIVGIVLRMTGIGLTSGEPSVLQVAAMNLFGQRSSLLLQAFLIGVCLYLHRYSIPISNRLTLALIGVAVMVSVFGGAHGVFNNALADAISLPLIVYLTVAIGLSRLPPIPGFGGGDYSYGLYLYHVPFMQLLIHLFPNAWTGEWWWTLFLAGFPVSLAAAMLSWHVVEYPVLKLRKSFAITHRPEDTHENARIPRVVGETA